MASFVEEKNVMADYPFRSIVLPSVGAGSKDPSIKCFHESAGLEQGRTTKRVNGVRESRMEDDTVFENELQPKEVRKHLSHLNGMKVLLRT